jgi:hypothetical protein
VEKDMTHFKISDEAAQAVLDTPFGHEGKTLRYYVRGDTMACGYGKQDVLAAIIEAALPVQFEPVYQQHEDGYWSDEHKSVMSWWEGRKDAPQFRIVYRIKESK